MGEQVSFGSLFAGIGGFDLGFEQAGMKCAWQVEMDRQCREILERHWPDVQRYGDVREIKSDELEAVNLICGGFPCQDLSVAGKRAGLNGARSGLWYEFRRIVEAARPTWVVVENVTGLLSSGKPRGADLEIILRGLAELGYMGAYRVLDSRYFGVAQRRRRVFIVGHLGDGRAVEVLFESEGVSGHPAESEAERQESSGPVTPRIGRSHTELDGHGKYIFQQNQRNEVRAMNKAGALQSEPGMKQQNYVYDARGYGDGETANTLTGDHMNRVTDYTPGVTAHRMRAFGDYEQDDKGSSMKARDHKDATDLIAGPVAGGAYGTGRRTEDDPNTIIQLGVRRLTPLECERLQGFPDGWTEGHADTARYRALGNAVCVPVAKWLGHRIVRADCAEEQDDG